MSKSESNLNFKALITISGNVYKDIYVVVAFLKVKNLSSSYYSVVSRACKMPVYGHDSNMTSLIESCMSCAMSK